MKTHSNMKLFISVMCSAALLLIIINETNGQYRGEPCRVTRRQRGRCLLLNRCPFAIQQLRRNVRPSLCGFEGTEPVVCCPRGGRNENINNPPPPGTKSKAKCQEYSNLNINEEPQLVTAVVGGVQASAKEFPHMAALGFGEKTDIQWQCGGTLISEEYVLTAGHCLYSQELGDVKYVRLGDLDLKSVTDDASPQDFRVTSIHRNPEYKPPQQYNDIGLVRLDRAAELTIYVKPACLYTQYELPKDSLPIATGWGRLGYTGETSDQLMKVVLSYFTIDKCRQVYSNVPQRRLPNGIDDDTQVCAGGLNEAKDTCQGDSGGPLQIKDFNDPKQFYVIGVTSFGKACGIQNIPGVYTRVSNYIPWIEETVWPDS